MAGESSLVLGLGFLVAFPISALGLAIVLHLTGPFATPNMSLSDMRTYNVPFQFI